MQNIVCPICENTGFTNKIEIKDYFLSQESFSITACNHCQFHITNPKPKENTIFQYYKSDAYISHSNTSKGFISKLYKKVRNINFIIKEKIVKKHTKQNPQILDFGCGAGYFLEHLITKKYEADGLEVENETAKQTETRLNKKIYSSIESISNKYDVITAWHVFEHLYNLNEDIKQLKSKLKDNGKIIIALPNRNSFDCYHYKQYWAAYDVPRHLYHFSEKDIVNLMQKHGFSYVEKKGMIFDSFYIGLNSEKYKKNFLWFISGIIVGLISNIYGLLSKEYSSMIYVFEKK